MRKFIIISLVAIMVFAMANLTFAITGSILVNSKNNGGMNYTDGFSMPFSAGTYEFSVGGGAWNSLYGLSDNWLWSLNILIESSLNDFVVGNDTTYSSALDAYNAHSSDSPLSLTLGSNDNLWFYISDSSPWNNSGAVAVNFTSELTPTVIPEPVSVVLFITGGALMAGRRFVKRKKY